MKRERYRNHLYNIKFNPYCEYPWSHINTQLKLDQLHCEDEKFDYQIKNLKEQSVIMIIDTLLEIFTRPIAKIIANKQKRTFFVDNRT